MLAYRDLPQMPQKDEIKREINRWIFLLLIGAAPKAIAYDSKQFTPDEFFVYGVYASIILMAVLAFAVYILWPLMGMPVKL